MGSRSISVVGRIPKVFENWIQKQLCEYLNLACLLTCGQSAFRQGFSATTAVYKLLDNVLNNTDEGLVNEACCFDLSKCFDTIGQTLLLAKMEK